MMVHGDHGSAWRMRQRRLRSWWRDEQQSVAMALSAAVHHSFDKVAAGDAYYGLRAQKTVRARAAHIVRRVAARVGPRTLGRSGGFSSTTWSTSLTSCRFSMHLCRG